MDRGTLVTHPVPMLTITPRRRVPQQPVPITRFGHEAMLAELRALADDPRSDPDSVLDLEATLGMVYVVDPPEDGSAGIGSAVTIAISGSTAPRQCRLVGPLECDLGRGDVSVDSPIGKALLGARRGDVVAAETPGGPRSVEILQVGGYR